MSAVNIPEAQKFLRPEQLTVQNLLIENGQLIETVAEYQRMGRIEEANKYQELLHRNLIFLARLADMGHSSHLLQEIGGIPLTRHSAESQTPSKTPQPNASIMVSAHQNANNNYHQNAPTSTTVDFTSSPQQHLNPIPGSTPQPQQFPSPNQQQPAASLHSPVPQQQQTSPASLHHQQQQATYQQRTLNVHPAPSQLPMHHYSAGTQQQITPPQQHPAMYTSTHGGTPHQQLQYPPPVAAYSVMQQHQQQYVHSAHQQQQFPVAHSGYPFGAAHQNEVTTAEMRQQYQQYGFPNQQTLQQQQQQQQGPNAQQQK